jgi:hypothetical protein
MFRCLARPLLVFPLLLIASLALAHDSWISRGALRNAAGEWCCGEGDCFEIPSEQVHIAANGYLLYGNETVPFSEAQPSPDGAYWRCKRPDGSRRCFFAPPQTY